MMEPPGLSVRDTIKRCERADPPGCLKFYTTCSFSTGDRMWLLMSQPLYWVKTIIMFEDKIFIRIFKCFLLFRMQRLEVFDIAFIKR